MEGGGLRMERDEEEFAHPYFRRGHDDKLELIKRKVTYSFIKLYCSRHVFIMIN